MTPLRQGGTSCRDGTLSTRGYREGMAVRRAWPPIRDHNLAASLIRQSRLVGRK